LTPCNPLWSNFKEYSNLFESGFNECKQRLEKSLAATIVNGKYMTKDFSSSLMIRGLNRIELATLWAFFSQVLISEYDLASCCFKMKAGCLFCGMRAPIGRLLDLLERFAPLEVGRILAGELS
jgi:hypothetical protein